MSETPNATDEPIDEAEARMRLAELIEQSEATSDKDGEEPTFDSPAQARAFGLVVSLSQAGLFEWSEFQRALIEQIEKDDRNLYTETERTYYDYWIKAAERLLQEEGYVSSEKLRERAQEFADGDRDASEFVIGDRDH